MSTDEQVYKYFKVVKIGTSSSGKTSMWDVLNLRDGQSLGRISWNGSWRCYVFQAASEMLILSAGCMTDLAQFLQAQDDAKKRMPK